VAIPMGTHVDDAVSATLNYADGLWSPRDGALHTFVVSPPPRPERGPDRGRDRIPCRVSAARGEGRPRSRERQVECSLRLEPVLVVDATRPPCPHRLRINRRPELINKLDDSRFIGDDPSRRPSDAPRLMHDIVTLGEVLLRLAIPSPARFETARALDVQIGGAEANVAAACARLGLRTAWISALPENPWGERVRRELVVTVSDCAYVRTLRARASVSISSSTGVAPRPVHVLYDRRDSAFSRLTADAVDWEPVRRARLVHVSGSRRLSALTRECWSSGSSPKPQASVILISTTVRRFGRRLKRAHLPSPVLPRARYIFLGRTRRKLFSDLTAVRRMFWTYLRDARRRPLSPCYRAGMARRCSMAAGCGDPRFAIPCRWSIQLARATLMLPATSGPRSVGGCRKKL